MSENTKKKILDRLEGNFVEFKCKKFYAPFHCLCCGKEISVEQFCYGRTCGYCDCGSCCKNGRYEIGHGRKDVFEKCGRI